MFKKNVVVYMLTGAVAAIVPFLLLPILTHRLSTAQFGVLSLIETIVVFTSPLILSGIQGAIYTEYFLLSQDDFRRYINNALALSFLAFLLILVLTIPVSVLAKNLGEMPAKLLVFIPAFALIRNVSSIILSIFQARQETYKYSISYISQVLLNLTLSYLFVEYANLGYIGRLGGIYVALAISVLVGAYWLKNLGYVSTEMVWQYTKPILHFSLPLIPHALSGAVLAMSDRFFISKFQNMSDVGTYSLAYQMASLMVIFAAATMQAWTPLLYSLLRINNTESKNKVKLATAWFIVLFLTIGTVLYFASDFIFELLISPKYFGAKIYFPWLLIGFVCQSIYFIFARVFFFYKKTLMLSVNTLSLATVNLVLNYTLIVRYGTVGVAYATAITWFIFMFIIGLSSSRLIERSCNGSLAA